MMGGFGPLLAALVALLLGIAVGKAWERYKLRDGRWIDRRKARESPHYILGLNFLVSHQLDQAIEELSKAASLDTDALEIHMILGNLYREKGQVGRAINLHQSLLQRPKLTKLEHAYVLLCLGLDFKRGGFVDRALETFSEVLRFDPDNQYALVNLEKLQEDQHQWQGAYEIRQKLIRQAGEGNLSGNQAILAFLETELGLEAMKRQDYRTAANRFEAAIELDEKAVPAYLNLGDVRMIEGNASQATSLWETVVQIAPERAYLTFDRLEAAYAKSETPDRFPQLCRRLIQENSQDWRGRLALANFLAARGEARPALELLFESLAQNPHSFTVHQSIWQLLTRLDLDRQLVGRYVELTRHSVFYLDPHVCIRCRYRSTELLWQCPHCHEWNTFVEERIAPAKDAEDPGA